MLAPSAIACSQAYNDLDATDLSSRGRHRDTVNRYILARDVLKGPARLTEKVVMVVDVGIEVRAPRLDHKFAQQTGSGKLVENVVNRRERDLNCRGRRFPEQLLRSDMPIIAVKQQPCQC